MKPLPQADLPQPNWPLLDCTINAMLRYCTTIEDIRLMARLVLAIDAPSYLALREKYADLLLTEGNPAGEQKYFDLAYWMAHKLLLVKTLGLDRKPAKCVLDLGTGVGHFLAVAGAYGNACLGTDIANPFYADLASLLRVRRDIMPVMRREALPALGGKFHLISAIWISFNTWFTTNPDGTSTRHHWSVEDWAFLFNDLLQNHLIYPGRIYFVLNQNYYADGSIGFDQELYDWFEGIGAQTDRAFGIVDLQLDHLRVLPPPKPRPPGATIQPESVPP